MQVETYEPPMVIELGDVRELTLGSAAHDTADTNVARYN
ncbi:lasso RiPP family leader peptide-containing protein [Allosalinactinospora lopnorensis]|nr:lasso RiPP family leader peptide-containing protein [Allosalinactinospora lopnorensis]